MKKIILLILISLLLVPFTLYAAGPKNPKAKVSIPAHAVEIAPGLFYLGTAMDKGRQVEGYAILMKSKDKYGKPGTECGNGICEPGENANKCPRDCGGGEDPVPDSTCYGFLSKGTKWKVVEDYYINPDNDRGLKSNAITSSLEESIAKWEDASQVPEIIGPYFTTREILIADTVSPDGKNEVYFGEIAEPDAIAITIVWGIFGGPPPWRELVEWDQVYDDSDYDWSEDCTKENCASKMDFPNIAIHELGHTVGLDDLYTSDCSDQTMYGYADFGETNKRTLEAGDILGVWELYK